MLECVMRGLQELLPLHVQHVECARVGTRASNLCPPPLAPPECLVRRRRRLLLLLLLHHHFLLLLLLWVVPAAAGMRVRWCAQEVYWQGRASVLVFVLLY